MVKADSRRPGEFAGGFAGEANSDLSSVGFYLVSMPFAVCSSHSCQDDIVQCECFDISRQPMLCNIVHVPVNCSTAD